MGKQKRKGKVVAKKRKRHGDTKGYRGGDNFGKRKIKWGAEGERTREDSLKMVMKAA